jgi:hypothetical protein
LGNDILVRFPSLLAHQYRVERASAVASTAWAILADKVPGTGYPVQITHPNALSVGQQFYRVTVLPEAGALPRRSRR